MRPYPGHFDVCIIQPSYLPWLGYFDQMRLADIFVFFDDVQFDKGGWRNRNRLLGREGPQWITAPVKKNGTFPTILKEMEIHSSPWQQKHLNMLKSLYGKAPFFDWCYPALDKLLSRKKYRWLVDLNINSIMTLSGLIGFSPDTRLSSEIGFVDAGRTERLVEICSNLKATRYISSDASKAYMKEELWNEAGIELVYQNYPHPTYRQFGRRFVSHLSAVDALMFVGPGAASFVGISHSKQTDCSPRQGDYLVT